VSKFFINRPIVAMVIAILMVIGGVISMLGLPTAQFPNIAPPEVQVSASYVGADADTVSQSVATPIEQQMSGVDHMNYMTSVNGSSGAMSLTIDFDIQTDPNIDQVLAQMRTSQANSQLPSAVISSGVTVAKSMASPLMLIALYSPRAQYDGIFVANYATINLNDAVTRIPGISNVRVFGAGQYAMRCWVKPDQLANLGITIPEIISAINAQNAVNPAGQIGSEPVPPGQEFTYTIRAPGRLPSAEEFGNIIIRAQPNGSIVRLREVARVELGAQTYNLLGRFSGKPAALMAVYQLPGSNAVAAAEGVRKFMEEAKTRFPPGLDYSVALDTTLAVTEGLKEIETTLLEALGLVIVVVFIFLQNWRAALIPLLAVPVSLLGTFIVFPLLGFSINTLSLFGLVLAIGLVVDDAIVVVEAVEHHIEEGLTPRDASLKAMEEVSGPVVAIALILVAVFLPTAFIPGITGRLYQQFAVTIAVSVAFSAFNALSLSPALAALMLRPREPQRGPLGWFFGIFNRGFARATNRYVATSALLIRKWAVGIALLLVLAAGAALFGSRLASGFLPDEDQGYLFGALQLPSSASLQRNSEAARQIEDIIEKTPGVQNVSSVVGYNFLSGVATTYNSFFFITLKNWSDRKTPAESYAGIKAHLQGALSKLPAGIAFIFPPPAIPGVGNAGGFSFVLEDRSGSGSAFLVKNLQVFMESARKRPELAGLNTTALYGVPQVNVTVDEAKVLTQGVKLGDVYQTLQTFMGGTLVNYFNRFGRQWQVYVQADGADRTQAQNVGEFYVKNAGGQMVPLSTLIAVAPSSGPEFIYKYNQYQAVQINGSAATGYSSGQAMAALEDVFHKSMPVEMGFDYTGMSFQEQEAALGVSPSTIFAISFLVVFLIMAAQYESWSLPFSVLLGTPIAVFGAFFALTLRGLENNVYAQIGLVMLIGLAAKNAILIVEFAKAESERNVPIADAALAGARLRLRPILMTAFAFILGCVPLWTASGAGAVARRVLGTTVIGGMLAASLIAIFFIPMAFDLVERLAARNRPPVPGALNEQAAGNAAHD
jgi:hydrophobic/amphiphilic exporter-1 (mainly G- bacteria), HAE1 family